MSNPKVLLIDVETSPNLGYSWGKYEQNIIAFQKESEILCYAAKWLDKEEVLTGKKNKKSNKNIATELWKLMDEADIVIAHNGDRFDIRVINACFLTNNLPPPSPFKTVDTRKVAKRYFFLQSNKLDDIGAKLDLGRKLKHEGIELWFGCMNDDPESWRKILEYNVQDIILLEKIYLRLRPWISNHPNYNYYTASQVACPKCGSSESFGNGTRYLISGRRQKRVCKNCHGHFQIKLDRKETATNL